MSKKEIILIVAILACMFAGGYCAYWVLQFGKAMGATFITFKDVMGAYGAGIISGGYIGFYLGVWLGNLR